MLTAIPKSFFSWDFDVFDGERFIAHLDMVWFREQGEVDIGGQLFQIGRERMLSGNFFIRKNGLPVATATKPSVFLRRFEVRIGDEQYLLRPTNVFARSFLLERAGQTVGEVRRMQLFSRRAVIDLPATIPLEARIFISWLVILMWRRQRKNSS